MGISVWAITSNGYQLQSTCRAYSTPFLLWLVVRVMDLGRGTRLVLQSKVSLPPSRAPGEGQRGGGTSVLHAVGVGPFTRRYWDAMVLPLLGRYPVANRFLQGIGWVWFLVTCRVSLIHLSLASASSVCTSWQEERLCDCGKCRSYARHLFPLMAGLSDRNVSKKKQNVIVQTASCVVTGDQTDLCMSYFPPSV